MQQPDLSDLDRAIYAAAFVDAFRNIYQDHPLFERTRLSREEAMRVVAWHRSVPPLPPERPS